MTPLFPPGLRVGCVPYLNARPLVWGVEKEVRFEVPSLLSDAFAQGQLDVALLPVFEVLRMGELSAVDGLSISAKGPVRSVFVAHRQPLKDVSKIVLDPSSRTSVNLLRVLLADYFHLSPRLVTTSADPLAARLLIGDPALAYRKDLDPTWQVTDLGEAWFSWTGKPFVFAIWVFHTRCQNRDLVARLLRQVAAAGMLARGEIAAGTEEPPVALDYLTRSIRFELGAAEKAGFRHFRDAVLARDLLPSPSLLPEFL